MARRVTEEDIKKINIEYLDCHSYAETARRTGWSASTVKNHIDPSFSKTEVTPKQNIKRFVFPDDMPQDDSYTELFNGVENYGELCALSDEERAEIKELWEEI